MIITVKGTSYKVELIDDNRVAIDGKIHTIDLEGNPFHDKLGRFTSSAGRKIGGAVESVKDVTGYNKLSENDKKRVKFLAAIAATVAATVVVTGAVGAHDRRNTRVESWESNGVLFKTIGTGKFDKQKLEAMTKDCKNLVDTKVGPTSLKRIVFAENHHVQGIYGSKIDEGAIYNNLEHLANGGLFDAKTEYETRLESLAEKSSMFKVSDIKRGAAKILLKIEPEIGGFTFGDSGNVVLSHRSVKETGGVLVHELIHTTKQDSDWFRTTSHTVAFQEACTEGIAKILKPDKHATAYDGNTRKLYKYCDENGLDRLETLKDMLKNPRKYSGVKLESVEDFKLSDAGVLIAVIQGQYDLVEDEFLDVMERHLKEDDNMKIVVDGTPYEYELTERGIILEGEYFELDEPITLGGNPYHDKLGRFAAKAGAIGGGFLSGAGAEAENQVRNLASDPKFIAAIAVLGAAHGAAHTRYTTAQKQSYDKMVQDATDSLPEGFKNPKLKVVSHGTIAGYITGGKLLGIGSPFIALSAGYCDGIGKSQANISPSVLRSFMDGNKTDRDWAKSVVIHESLHTRPRTGSMNMISIHYKRGIEEGLNDTLTERFSKTQSTPAYKPYRDAVTKMAMYLNDDNHTKAVQWIDDMHKKSVGPLDLAKQLSVKSGQKVKWGDVVDYVNYSPEMGSLRSDHRALSLLGDKRNYSYKFNEDKVKSRPYMKADASLSRLITGAAEVAAVNYSSSKIRVAIAQTIYRGIIGGMDATKSLEEGNDLTPTLPDLLSSIVDFDQFTAFINALMESADKEGIPRDDITDTVMVALDSLSLAGNEEPDEETLNEWKEMQNDFD